MGVIGFNSGPRIGKLSNCPERAICRGVDWCWCSCCGSCLEYRRPWGGQVAAAGRVRNTCGRENHRNADRTRARCTDLGGPA